MNLNAVEGQIVVAKQRMAELQKERTEHIKGIAFRVDSAKMELKGFISTMRNMDSDNKLITETQSMLD